MEENEKIELQHFTNAMLKGAKEAARKLMEERAAQGKSLVVEVDGKVKHVPAKELLQKLKEKH